MEIQFSKYQGAGNDFVMIDNRKLDFPKGDIALIAKLCDRRFGIGADGLILLEEAADFDFKMVYFNADGKESSMCGNGGRCIVAFAKELNLIEQECEFIAIDGVHHASFNQDERVSLGMIDVEQIEQLAKNDYFLNTGSPHFVRIVNSMPENFVEEAKKIRHNERFNREGVNVNFVIIGENQIQIRTFERGVEDETLACGTGAVAAALVTGTLQNKEDIQVKTLGGVLKVSYKSNYKYVLLNGPADKVFHGIICI